LIRLPEDNRSIAFSSELRLPDKIRDAEIDGTFVLATTPVAIKLS
jgi:hypothetical protein